MQIHGDRLRFGVHSGQQYRSFSECLELWQRVESLGYDWVSLFDHFRPPLGGPDGPCFEGTTLLAALAARTSTVRCAMLVSAVTWRHPAIVAAAAATIDHISGGRLEFGIGAAGSDLAYDQYGIAFPSASDRLDMLDEACRVIRGLWSGRQTDFTGKHYILSKAYLEPQPVQPHLPLIIGGEGRRRTLRIVAEHADIWNTLAGSPASYRELKEVLQEHCAAVGRDPDSIRKSVTFRVSLSTDAAGVAEARRRLEGILPPGSPVWAEYLVHGTPADCVERLKPFIDLGVRDFILGARPPVHWQSVDLFARDVIPELHAYHRASSRLSRGEL